MGGASGIIFGSLYLAGGRCKKEELNASDLAGLFQRSLQAIQARGGAQVGDKTMIHALSPAVDAMLANSGNGIAPMLEAMRKPQDQVWKTLKITSRSMVEPNHL